MSSNVSNRQNIRRLKENIESANETIDALIQKRKYFVTTIELNFMYQIEQFPCTKFQRTLSEGFWRAIGSRDVEVELIKKPLPPISKRSRNSYEISVLGDWSQSDAASIKKLFTSHDSALPQNSGVTREIIRTKIFVAVLVFTTDDVADYPIHECPDTIYSLEDFTLIPGYKGIGEFVINDGVPLDYDGNEHYSQYLTNFIKYATYNNKQKLYKLQKM